MATLNDWSKHPIVSVLVVREIGHNLDAWRLTHPISPSPFVFNPEVGVTTSDYQGEW